MTSPEYLNYSDAELADAIAKLTYSADSLADYDRLQNMRNLLRARRNAFLMDVETYA